jgi:succinyl-CoA synthetase beta subunit
MIGERGPEAVVPLSRGGGVGAITINVNGGISTSAEIGQSVYNALLQYKQIYGPLSAISS